MDGSDFSRISRRRIIFFELSSRTSAKANSEFDSQNSPDLRLRWALLKIKTKHKTRE